MIIGILLAVGIIIIVFMFLRVKDIKHRVFWVVLFFVFVILFLGYWMVLAGKNINYNSLEGIQTAGKLYLGWMANGFNNFKVLTSNAISMDWRDTGNGSFSIIKQEDKKNIKSSNNSNLVGSLFTGSAVKSDNKPLRK